MSYSHRAIVPAENHYVLEPLDLNEVDPSIKPLRSGIVIPSSANNQDALKAGKVVAYPYNVAGQMVVPYKEDGTIVLYPKGSGYEVKLDDKKYIVIAFNQIVGSVVHIKEEKAENNE